MQILFHLPQEELNIPSLPIKWSRRDNRSFYQDSMSVCQFREFYNNSHVHHWEFIQAWRDYQKKVPHLETQQFGACGSRTICWWMNALNWASLCSASPLKVFKALPTAWLMALWISKSKDTVWEFWSSLIGMSLINSVHGSTTQYIGVVGLLIHRTQNFTNFLSALAVLTSQRECRQENKN